MGHWQSETKRLTEATKRLREAEMKALQNREKLEALFTQCLEGIEDIVKDGIPPLSSFVSAFTSREKMLTKYAEALAGAFIRQFMLEVARNADIIPEI
jgi:hypothetical protein